jgi:hypothetical protein
MPHRPSVLKSSAITFTDFLLRRYFGLHQSLYGSQSPATGHLFYSKVILLFSWPTKVRTGDLVFQVAPFAPLRSYSFAVAHTGNASASPSFPTVNLGDQYSFFCRHKSAYSCPSILPLRSCSGGLAFPQIPLYRN